MKSDIGDSQIDPTLSSLAMGINPPTDTEYAIEGLDASPLLDQPFRDWKKASFSQVLAWSTCVKLLLPPLFFIVLNLAYLSIIPRGLTHSFSNIDPVREVQRG